MQRCPREADSSSASQAIFRVLCNPKVHCPVQKGSPLVTVLSQISPAHALSTGFFKIRQSVFHSLRQSFPNCLSRSRHQTLYVTQRSPVCTTWPVHLIHLDFIARKIVGEEYKTWSSDMSVLRVYKHWRQNWVHRLQSTLTHQDEHKIKDNSCGYNNNTRIKECDCL